MRWRITSQKRSAPPRESSNAIDPASDFPSASLARWLSSVSVLRPLSSLDRLSRLCSIAPSRSCRTNDPAASTASTAKTATMALGRAKNLCSGDTSRSPPGSALMRGAPRNFSKIASSAGTSAKVNTQHSSIPIPPMNPK